MPQTYHAQVLADSTCAGVRLTTLLVRFPRIILAEVNTHRMLSRCSASSRAVPVEKRIAAVRADPFVPESFGKNQRGMTAGAELNAELAMSSRDEWLAAAEAACAHAEALAQLGVHKQWANRLIEPFSWHEAIISATEWSNFFNLRISPLAQPEMRRTAEAMKAAMSTSTPRVLRAHEWHLPLVTDEERADLGSDLLIKLSVARCARVSYLSHEGKRDLGVDFDLHDRLLRDGHLSPFGHVAVAHPPATHHYGEFDYLGPDCIICGAFAPEDDDRPCTPFCGNFRSAFVQYRKLILGEYDIIGSAKRRAAAAASTSPVAPTSQE